MWSSIDYQQQNGWYRPKPSSGGGLSFIFKSSSDSISAGTSVSYTSMTWTSSQNVIVAIGYNGATNGVTVSSVTVGAQSAVHVSGAAAGDPGAGIGTDIWVTTTPPSGTTGTVTVVYSSTLDTGTGSSIALYSTNSSTIGSAVSGSGFQGFGTSVTTSSFTVPSGGAYVGVVASGTLSGGSTFTFAGSETIDHVDPSNMSVNMASKISTSGSTTVSASHPPDNFTAAISAIGVGP